MLVAVAVIILLGGADGAGKRAPHSLERRWRRRFRHLAVTGTSSGGGGRRLHGCRPDTITGFVLLAAAKSVVLLFFEQFSFYDEALTFPKNVCKH